MRTPTYIPGCDKQIFIAYSMQAASPFTDSLKALETVPSLYLVLSPQLIILTASNAYLAAMSLERSRIAGKHIREVFSENAHLPDGLNHLQASLQQVLTTRQCYQSSVAASNVPHPTEAGKRVHLYWLPSYTPVLNDAGEIQYIIQEVVNVTQMVQSEARVKAHERKSALARARFQRDRMEKFFMQLPAAIAVLDGPMMVFELVNPTFQKYFPGRKLVGLPFLEAIPEARHRFYWPIMQKVFQKGETYVGKQALFRLVRQIDGAPEDTYLDVNYQPRYNENDEVDGIILFAYDVTEMFVARQAVEESRKQFQLLADTIPELVWTATPDGNLNYFNGQTYHYSGKNFEQLKGQKWADIIHPDDLPHLMKNWTHALQTGDPYQVEVRVRGSDGTYQWFLIRALAFRNEQGNIIQWFGATTNIDTQKQLEKQLQELTEKLAATNEELIAANEEIQVSNEELDAANKRLNWINTDLDTFVYTASHDLRSPVNQLLGLHHLLEYTLGGKLDQAGLDLLQHIQASLEKLNLTILDLSKIIAEQPEGIYEYVNFKDIFADVKADIEPLITQSKAYIDIHFEIPFIDFPRKHLRSILYNLLSNALKYRDVNRPCHIIVRTQKKKDQVLLSISDNGLGLGDQEQKKLFLAFQRMHPHVDGSGVGLYIIKRIIDNNGGTITVNSQKGVGTTFTVHFKA